MRQIKDDNVYKSLQARQVDVAPLGKGHLSPEMMIMVRNIIYLSFPTAGSWSPGTMQWDATPKD